MKPMQNLQQPSRPLPAPIHHQEETLHMARAAAIIAAKLGILGPALKLPSAEAPTKEPEVWT